MNNFTKIWIFSFMFIIFFATMTKDEDLSKIATFVGIGLLWCAFFFVVDMVIGWNKR